MNVYPDKLNKALFANKLQIVSRVLEKTGFDASKAKPESQDQASFYDIEEKIKSNKKSTPQTNARKTLSPGGINQYSALINFCRQLLRKHQVNIGKSRNTHRR